MLSQLQAQLADFYRVDAVHDVTDFLITDPLLAKLLAGDALIPDTDESVLVQQDEEGILLSVFLDRELLERLDEGDPLKALTADQLDDLCTVLEGISHFNYLTWNASNDRNVSLLELEIQAEIDKFISALFIALHQDEDELVTNMHRHLFDQVSFRPSMTAEQRDRYATANDYAARFCHRLHARLSAQDQGAMRELRRFYRLTERQKISHIHSRVFAQ